MDRKERKGFKRTPRSPWFYFIQDFKKKEEKAGRKRTLEEICTTASPLWEAMSPAERLPFEERACKGKIRSVNRERFTSLGHSISSIDKKQLLKSDSKIAQNEIIVDMLSSSSCIVKEEFFLLTFNYFWKTLDGTHSPCELGIVRFSVAKGIIDKFHSFINPGPLPRGYSSRALLRANETHQLPIPPNAKGYSTQDYDTLLSEIVNFIEGDDLLIYVLEDEEDMVKDILGQITKSSSLNAGIFTILPADVLFFELRVALEHEYCFDPPIKFTVEIAKSFIHRDMFDFLKGVGCPDHDDPHPNLHCALSRVTRLAYTILDQTLDVAFIEKKKGVHYPKGFVTNSAISRTYLNLTKLINDNSSTVSLSSIEEAVKESPQDKEAFDKALIADFELLHPTDENEVPSLSA